MLGRVAWQPLAALLLLSLYLGGCPTRSTSLDGPRSDAPAPDHSVADLALDHCADHSADHPTCLGDRPMLHDLLSDAAADAAADAPADSHREAATDAAAEATLVDLADDFALDLPLLDSAGAVTCPAGMVVVAGKLCMDRYEASRPDATSSAEGTGTSHALNVKGVIPWQGVDLKTARAACKAAGKYLCKLNQWIDACQGPKKLIYGYGNTYDPTRCNGIDKYCYCGSTACTGITPCPFAGCINTCWANFVVDPTGASPGCTNHWGALDINGNVWELTDSTDGLEHFRGGAFNCGNSQSLHRCDHDGTWGPSARGFRCCADPINPGG